MLPSNSPLFFRMSRPHNKLFVGEFECAWQVFADKCSHQCTLHMEGEGVSGFVDLVRAKGGFVAPARILNGRIVGSCLRTGRWIPIHHLNRHVAVPCVDKQPGAVSLANRSVCALLLKPGEPPRSDKSIPHISSPAILAAGQSRCADTEKHARYSERKQFLHVRLLAPKMVDSASH